MKFPTASFLAALALLACPSFARAGTAAAVHLFNGDDGASPYGSVLQANDGNLYGTTSGQNNRTSGTVFKVSPDGATFQTLHVFGGTDGAGPYTGLLQANDGNLYGTTTAGGAHGGGVLFVVSPDGATFRVLHNFGADGNDGKNPHGDLIQAADGQIYGTTMNGAANDRGTVFTAMLDGSAYRVLHVFGGGTDGESPEAGLLQASDGRLYGTTSSDGINSEGTMYSLALGGGDYRLLFRFNVDGTEPLSSLIELPDGTLCGTTFGGGISYRGTVFKIKNDGTGYQTLHDFVSSDGTQPQGVPLLASDGKLHGTTITNRVYTLATDGTAFATPETLGVSTSYYSSAPLIQGGSGLLYGTGPLSANYDGGVFSADEALPNVVQFHQSVYSVNQATGTAQVRVDRVGDDPYDLALIAYYTLTDGTAKVDTDYTDDVQSYGEVTWYNGDVTPKFITVNVVNHGETDGNMRTLSLTLNDLAAIYFPGGPGTSLGYPTKATLTINAPIPSAPIITSAATATATAGQPFAYQIEASASPRHYGALHLPRGLTVNPDTGLISGTPILTGTFNLTINANNAAGKGTASLAITTELKAPVITSAATLTAHLGDSFTYTITASGLPKKFGTTGLGGDTSVNPDTGVITGTPLATGTKTLTLQASNAAGTGTQTLTLTVDRIAPEITSPGMAQGSVGQPFSYQITAKYAPGSFGAMGLPKGLSIDSTTGKITGVPIKAGTFTLTLKAINSAGSDSEALTLTVGD